MIGALVSLLLIGGASLIVGMAIAAVAGGADRERPLPVDWLAPAYGIGALLVIAGVAARLPGRTVTAAGALLMAPAVAAWFLRGRISGVREAATLAAPVVAITVAATCLPFALAGEVGILGVGLVNDDMASHLIIADYVTDPAGTVPSFVKGGYPIGPHAVVAAVATGTGVGLVEAFAGLTLVLAAVLGLLGLGILADLPRGRRILGACLIALPYLGAAYLAQGAFKEPLQAILLIGFALCLARLIGLGVPGAAGVADDADREPTTAHPLLRVLPLGILAAASVFNYSLPGLLWVGAVGGAVVLARLLLVKPRPQLPEGWARKLAPYAAGVVVVVALATAQEWSRIADFSRLEALNPDRFGSELGNLRQALSPLEALGIWPSGEYRVSATSGSLPAPAFYLGAAIALAALVLGLLRSRRNQGLTLAGTLVAVLAVWGLAALFSSPYIAAKALAIAAPVAMAIALRGTLGARGPALALGVVFVLGAGLSSFLVLRQSPVGPDDHSQQIESLREIVADEEVLFLGRDDFIGWELRGSGEITGIVTNFYDVEDSRPRFKKGEGGGEKFDVDAVFPATLDSFPYVLATTGGPVSTVPPRFREVERTRDYVLYENLGGVGKRRTLEEGTEPGALLPCNLRRNRQLAFGKGTAVIWRTEPVIAEPDAWSPDAEPTDGSPARAELPLPEGRWLISLEYDSRRPLRVSAPAIGLETTIAANLDFRGETPYFPVAEVDVDRVGPVEFTIEPEQPNLLARALRAPNEAHLRSISATPLDPGSIARVQKREMCNAYVDWYREG